MIGPATYGLIAFIFAGIVHLSTILAMPWLAPKDGFSRLSAFLPDNQMSLITERDDRESALPYYDPAVVTAACRFVLDKGPVRIRIVAGQLPISLLLIRRGIGIFHSVSDRVATQGVLELVVATQEQMDQITAQDVDDDPVQELRVVSADDVGIALVRGLATLPSQQNGIKDLLERATCESESLDQPG